MEEEFLLDPNDDFDIFCLHFLYLPTINKHLDMFRHAYMNHRMRTIGHLSPIQMWRRNINENDLIIPDLSNNVSGLRNYDIIKYYFN